MPAGYSNTPLPRKLGIKEGFKVAFLNPPEGYGRTLGKLPPNVVLVEQPHGSFDIIQFFTRRKAELESRFATLKESLSQNGALWVSWPKRSSRVDTDLNENLVREIGLNSGLVDVKICAVDETWSGLKFVRRLKDRKGR